MPSSGKRLQLTRPLLLAPLSHTGLCCLLVPTRESRPSRRARSARGWSFALTPVPERKRHPDVTHHQEGKQTTDNGALCEPTGQTQSVDFSRTTRVSLTRVRRRSLVVYVDMVRKSVVVPSNKLEQTLNAAARPHSGPWLKYLWSMRN